MSPAGALAEIRGLAGANRIEFTDHALVRMRERRVRKRDVRHALMAASGCLPEGSAKWKVASRDLDGDDLTVVVAIEDGLLVVTVF